MRNKLILYVDPVWNRNGIHSPLMNPWWGNPIVPESIFSKQLYDTYTFDTSLYAITDSISEAELVFAPYRHAWLLQYDPALFKECIRTAQEAGLPLLIDGVGDVEYPIDIPNTYVLRYGGYRFLPERGRIQIPPLADDLLVRCRSGNLEIRKKTNEKPHVGFAGWASLSPKQFARTILKELPARFRGIFDSRYRTCTKGVLWRRRAIRLLARAPQVTFSYHVRGSFSGSPKTAGGDMQMLREEMVETILDSDYALDVRGDANDSTRLFEILSLGRIPVIVDTERNFPFKDKVDYNSFALIVDFRDIQRLPERIAEFHRTVTPDRFEEMQRNARDAYVRYFRMDALMRPIIEELRGLMAAEKR